MKCPKIYKPTKWNYWNCYDCKNGKYGCCPDGITAKIDDIGSNCDYLFNYANNLYKINGWNTLNNNQTKPIYDLRTGKNGPFYLGEVGFQRNQSLPLPELYINYFYWISKDLNDFKNWLTNNQYLPMKNGDNVIYSTDRNNTKYKTITSTQDAISFINDISTYGYIRPYQVWGGSYFPIFPGGGLQKPKMRSTPLQLANFIQIRGQYNFNEYYRYNE